MTDSHRTRRWRGVIVVALAAGAVGLLFKRPSVVLLSVVGVTFAAYPRVLPPPQVDLDLERSLSTTTPGHNDTVEVTVRLHNTGDQTLADLRLVDGVPPMLSVADGSPRHSVTLLPGGTTEFSYDVTARHGTHSFEPATVIARDIAGATEVETEVAAETTIECLGEIPEVPLREQTRGRVGQITTDEGGSGVEFHRTREYRHGDALNRIDWQRFARTGELATTEFRQERSAAVVLCIDAREPAYRGRTDEPHAVAYGQAAAEQLLTALNETPDAVGVTSLSENGDGREPCWLPPGSGRDHYLRARQLLASHPSLSVHPPAQSTGEGWDAQVATLRRRLDTDVQVVFLSPLLDSFAASTAMTLEAVGRAVTVVTPDVTTDESTGGRLVTIERDNRIHSLRGSGIPVIDWDPDESLGATLVRASEGWSG